MYHLDIIEKDYFGLRFMDSAQVPVRILTYVLFFFIYLFILMLLFVTVWSTSQRITDVDVSPVWSAFWSQGFSLSVNGSVVGLCVSQTGVF